MLAEKTRKELNKVFKELGLKITSQTNLKVVDYLDITLDLNKEIYSPYRKPNNEPTYINARSNHPPAIIKHIPEAIQKRISSLSSNTEIFKNAAPVYNEALANSGYNQKITCKAQEQKEKTKNRSRKIIWFNPPYSANVKTNIGEFSSNS